MKRFASRVLRHSPKGGSCAILLTGLLFGFFGCDEEPAAVVVIGHRGAPTLAVENSMESFEIAKKQGADGVEFDVLFTADGKNIVMHDETLDRTTTCTGTVVSKTITDIQSCNLVNGEPVRTLDEILAKLGPMFSILFVELKASDTRYEEQADEAVRAVLASGFAQKIVLSSYQPEINARLATRQPDGIHAGWDDPSNDSLTLAKDAGSEWVLMPIAAVKGSEGHVATAIGKHVVAYTITTQAQFETASRAGITVMMTDSVPTLRALVAAQ